MITVQLPLETDATALVIDRETGEIYDETYGWEAAVNYALYSPEYSVVVMNGDAHLTRDQLQKACDSDRAAWADCFDLDDDEGGCPGHESLAGAHMGEAVYCDGTCAQAHPA